MEKKNTRKSSLLKNKKKKLKMKRHWERKKGKVARESKESVSVTRCEALAGKLRENF